MAPPSSPASTSKAPWRPRVWSPRSNNNDNTNKLITINVKKLLNANDTNNTNKVDTTIVGHINIECKTHNTNKVNHKSLVCKVTDTRFYIILDQTGL